MPRLSPDTLLQRAIEPAVQDRIALADAYGREGEIATEATEHAKRIQALQGRKFKSLSADDLELARLAFVFAEQWDSSLAVAQGPGRDGRKSAESARLFREFRLFVWGKTQMEAMIDDAVAVDAMDLINGSRPDSSTGSKVTR